jgi:transcriptional regulator with XRE-family HTH domain
MSKNYKKRLPEGPFYKNLGRTIRVTRTAAGRSQMDTAGHLDVTFQQLQKYESGINRIPVDRLVCLAAYLDVPVSHFVTPGGPSDDDSAFLSLIEKFEGKEFKTLVESWTAIKDRTARAALLNLMKCMATAKR